MRTPTLPRIDTLTAGTIMRLMVGQKLTHRNFHNETASYRLCSYIESFRNRYGWPIVTWQEKASADDPKGCTATSGRYLIATEVLAELRKRFGEQVARFIESGEHFEQGAQNDK